MERKQLGRRIKEVRKERGLTADATYLRQIEGGSKTPSLPVFTDLCNALHISPAYLLQDELCWNEFSNLGELSRLWTQADPRDIELVTAIVRTALECRSTPEIRKVE